MIYFASMGAKAYRTFRWTNGIRLHLRHDHGSGQDSPRNSAYQLVFIDEGIGSEVELGYGWKEQFSRFDLA
jgi:hypothetical protein